MTSYWVSFRVAHIDNFQVVYDNLNDVISGLADNGKWWVETTSFYVFRSRESSQRIAELLRNSIRPQYDLVVLGSFDKKICKIIGSNEDSDIYDLVDFASDA